MSSCSEEPHVVNNTRLLEARPLYTPPKELREAYLASRRSELEALVSMARENEWKYVVTTAHHVRGTGAMYGFANIGTAAENLCKAIQNGDPNCRELLEKYVNAVNEAYV